MKSVSYGQSEFESISQRMNIPGGMDMDKCVAKMARIIAAATEEIKPVLVKIKMNASKMENMKSLDKCLGGPAISNEMLANTLAFLKDTQAGDEDIAGLLKEGKKESIIREVFSLMPLPCLTCTMDVEFQPGDRPQVRCRRCKRGACVECLPEPKTGWVYLCSICDKDVQKEQSIPESLFTARKRKGAEKPATQETATQNRFENLELEEGEEDEEDWEEEERKREEKRKNENRGRSVDKEKEKVKEVCKAFKFGGKCPHGMRGNKKHMQWEHCNKAHPKVCNKLLAQGTRGCDGKECEKYHPKMCYSSMNSKRCTREKCTFWHCKGTSFQPESRARYEPPSRNSLGNYPNLPARRGRSPGRREQEGRHRPREEEPGRREREERGSIEEEQERRRRDERNREERNREERNREERKREERRPDSASFLDIAQLIRQEVQRALLPLLPLLPSPGAGGSVTGLPRNQNVTTGLNWAELCGRSRMN